MMIINPPFVPHILVSADMSITHVFQHWSIKNLWEKKYDLNDGYCANIYGEKPRWYSCSLSFGGEQKFTSRHLFFRLKLFLLPSTSFYTRSFFLFSRFYIFLWSKKIVSTWCECWYWNHFISTNWNGDDHLFILNFLCNELSL